LRWFSRYLDEGKDVTLLKAQLVVVALAALGGSGHDEAVSVLGAFVGIGTRKA
jgi:hypothetical protein